LGASDVIGNVIGFLTTIIGIFQVYLIFFLFSIFVDHWIWRFFRLLFLYTRRNLYLRYIRLNLFDHCGWES